jgi:hypothetical protein
MIGRRLGHLLVVASVMLTACERVVDLDLPEGTRRLVVEGRLERVIGSVSPHQVIRLSTTSPYFADDVQPPASGASVRVTDESGHTVTFAEAEPGQYVTDELTVVVGMRYTLHITWGGEDYQASEVAQGVAPILDLYFDPPKPGRFSGEEGVRATIDLEDPAGVENYYLWDQFIDGVRVLGPDSTFRYRVVAYDDAFDGLAIRGFQPYEGIDIPPGAMVLMRQVGLSKDMYRYYFALSDQVSSDGSPFAVPPSSVRGNVANLSDALHYPLGYFHAAEVAEQRRTYQVP